MPTSGAQCVLVIAAWPRWGCVSQASEPLLSNTSVRPCLAWARRSGAPGSPSLTDRALTPPDLLPAGPMRDGWKTGELRAATRPQH